MHFSQRLSSLSGLILVGIVSLAAAFTSPTGKPYGVTPQGQYWISSALVNGADGIGTGCHDGIQILFTGDAADLDASTFLKGHGSPSYAGVRSGMAHLAS